MECRFVHPTLLLPTLSFVLHTASFVIYKLFIKTKSNVLLKFVTVREEHESTEEANEDEPIKIKKRK